MCLLYVMYTLYSLYVLKTSVTASLDLLAHRDARIAGEGAYSTAGSAAGSAAGSTAGTRLRVNLQEVR